MARIAITDGLSPAAISQLQDAGHEVVEGFIEIPDLDAGALADFDAIIVRSATKVRRPAIEAGVAGSLRVIGRAGVGVDNIDIPDATEFGVMVVNAPFASSWSVAELTLSHLLASARHIPRADRDLRAGQWTKKDLKGTELAGKRLGFIGFGRIAQFVGQLAKAFGMELHAYDPYLPPEVAAEQGCTLHSDLKELFSLCTHITIHAMLNDETRGMVNADLFSLMPGVAPDGIKCGNHLVSCARGGIVDEEAALSALESGELASVALDVFATEPVPADHPLLQHPNFHGTPHIGASTMEAQGRVGLDTAEAMIAALAGEVPATLVNKDVVPRA